MKLYDFSLAPNPKRVRMFLAEKGLDIPMVQVNLRELEQFEDGFQSVSTHSVVPVLELDDGTRIGESVAICRYIEAIHPEPPLLGTTPTEIGVIEMWNRRCEIEGFQACGEAVRNSAPMFEGRGLGGARPGEVPQISALVERGTASAQRFFKKLEVQLADNTFVAGERLSIADITAYMAIEFGQRAGISVPNELTNVHRWYDAMAARPSAAA